MKKKGRQSKYTEAERARMVLDWYLDPEMSVNDMASKYGICRATAENYIREWKERQKDLLQQES